MTSTTTGRSSIADPVPVLEGVDAAGLREHVQASEPVTFIEALRAIIAGRIDLDAVR